MNDILWLTRKEELLNGQKNYFDMVDFTRDEQTLFPNRSFSFKLLHIVGSHSCLFFFFTESSISTQSILSRPNCFFFFAELGHYCFILIQSYIRLPCLIFSINTGFFVWISSHGSLINLLQFPSAIRYASFSLHSIISE